MPERAKDVRASEGGADDPNPADFKRDSAREMKGRL